MRPARELLADKLAEAGFREREGFPVAADADILRLSEPPFHTCCPNPFVAEVLAGRGGGRSPRRVDAFAGDITEGKTERFYNLHTYHTKVPYRAIARFLLHYTDPGDVVLDGFAGSGMVGVAAQACASPEFAAALSEDATPGARVAVLNDLSPAATQIAAGYNAHVDGECFARECREVLEEFRAELGWMFQTRDPATGEVAPVDYFVWSDVFECPACGHELVFWDAGVDRETGYKTAERLAPCGGCGAEIAKADLVRSVETYDDDLLGTRCRRQRERLVRIVYRRGRTAQHKQPDEHDHRTLRRIAEEPVGPGVPLVRMLHRDGAWGDMHRAGYHLGITHLHHFYTRRSLRAVAWLWRRVERSPQPLRAKLRWWLQSVGIGHTRLNRYFASSYSQVNRYLKGFLYVAQVRAEVSPWYALSGKIRAMSACPPGRGPVFISTGSATALALPDESVDYVFTDPPFGGNIRYSELNFLWEAWLGAYTDHAPEAVISEIQRKGLPEYRATMQRAFAEFYRVLKPGRWITLLFHNSDSSVWQAMQAALQQAGFVVGGVSVFDRKQLTMKQQTAAGSVRNDLIISAYRPTARMQRATLGRGGAGAVWEFVRSHLRQLPEAAAGGERLEERTAVVLFDRMVAFFVQRGVAVPMSAASFYAGLDERFEQRGGIYFAPPDRPRYPRAVATRRGSRPGREEHADQVRRRLAAAIPEPRCELDHHNPWQLLVATILSAQSTDKMANSVTPALFARWPDPAALGDADQAEVERAVKSTGFFRNKAKAIRGASQMLAAEYGGEVPRDLETLMELPGVARKTANLVIGTAYRKATGIVVDTHAARVSQRLGLTAEKDPVKIEADLCARFHKRSWIDLGHRLVLHGRYVCLARTPRCEQCPLNEVCPSRQAQPMQHSWTARARWEKRLVESRGELDR